MEALMSSSFAQPIKLNRGEQVLGKVITITDTEIILDLGTKAEGVMSKKDLSSEQLADLKLGDKLEVFVVNPENESGQAIVSAQKQLMIGGRKGAEISKKWQKFYNAMQQKSKLKGKVLEINKGGLVVEMDSIRGFLPSSQISALSLAHGMDKLVGQDLSVMVIEVDPTNNRLIFSGRSEVSQEAKVNLDKLEIGQEIEGKIGAVLPFGLFIDLDGVEGLIFNQELSWEQVENPASEFKEGQEVKAVVIGKDEEQGKALLSIKRLSEDPFEKLVEDFQVDDVVKGTIKEVTQTGVSVALKNNMEGLLPATKMEQGVSYTPGEEKSFLVDSVDKAKRRINLVPFVTSTEGLFYR